MPVKSPVSPAPSEPAKPADSEAETERQIRAAEPDSRVRIPSRPGHDGIAVNQPGIIGRNINHCGVSRLNLDIRAIVLHDFLLRGLQSAGIARFAAHYLNRIHHILLLVVVSVAER